MIKVILLKDAELNRGVVFCKAVVQSEQGFEMQIATGYIRKPKTLVAPKGTVAFELENVLADRLVQHTESFTVEATATEPAEIKQVTYLTIK